MSNNDIDNKVQLAQTDVRVTVKNNSAYIYRQQEILSEFPHPENYKLLDALIFKNVLYTNCAFSELKPPYRLEKTAIFMWKEGKSHILFVGEYSHLFEMNNQLWISNQEQHGIDCFFDTERFVFYNIKDDVVEKSNHHNMKGYSKTITTTGTKTYILNHTTIYEMGKVQFRVFRDVDTISLRSFFCDKNTAVVDNNVYYEDQKIFLEKESQVVGICENHVIYYLSENTVVFNPRNNKKMVLDGEWKISREMLCKIENGKVLHFSPASPFYYLLPNLKEINGKRSCFVDFLVSRMNEINCLSIINSYLVLQNNKTFC